jgi:hypothetical protein
MMRQGSGWCVGSGPGPGTGTRMVEPCGKVVCWLGKAEGWRKRTGKGKRLREKAKKYGGPG